MGNFLQWFLNTLMAATLIGGQTPVQTPVQTPTEAPTQVSRPEVDFTKSYLDYNSWLSQYGDPEEFGTVANEVRDSIHFAVRRRSTFPCILLDLTLGHELGHELATQVFGQRTGADDYKRERRHDSEAIDLAKKILIPVIFQPAVEKLMNKDERYYNIALAKEIIKKAKDNGVDISMLNPDKGATGLLADFEMLHFYIASFVSSGNDCSSLSLEGDSSYREVDDSLKFCKANPKEDSCEKFLEKVAQCKSSSMKWLEWLKKFNNK